jgi:predicted nucleic acid-binding protein
MTTAIDTNVLVALWNPSDSLNTAAASAIVSIPDRLMICGAVYAELLASPSRTEDFLNTFFSDARIDIDWTIDENIWRIAGRAYSKYATRRRKTRSGHPRRILADFLIGAHAYENGYSLLTLDKGLYRQAFPKLRITCI